MTIQQTVRGLLGRGALVLLGASAAHAQNAPVETESGQRVELEEVIVTGTLIRGTTPTGTNVVPMNREEIIATGASTANDVLSTIPQISSNFNRVRSLPSGATGITALSPIIRDLGAAGGTTTLVLMDGHRLVNAGVLSTSPDPDVIPPSVLERVEVVPDGGSSLYGSDAVGGIINFITRKNIEGLEVAGHYGVADEYYTTDVELTAGHGWASGSAYLSYMYTSNDEIFGADRDFMLQTTDNLGTCGAGTVFNGTGSGATSYALPDRTPGTITNCDTTDAATLYPEQTRNSVFGALTQELGDSATIGVRAFYTKRETVGSSDPANAGTGGAGQTVVICAAAENCPGGIVFPGYIPVAGDTGVQRVAFNYGGVIDTRQPSELEEYQVTPTLTVDLGAKWQLRVLGSYGLSSTDFSQQEVDTGVPQSAAIASGGLNPYNVQATSPTVMNSLIRNFIGQGDQEMINGRAVVDGQLFDLPGGSVRLAAGVEYLQEKLKDVVFGSFALGTEDTAVPTNADRDVSSVFAEVVIPIVGGGNAITGIHELTLSASARYDDYSDFGDTTNPKFGVTYQPVDWVTFRGNVGKSFNAPSLADTNAPDTRSFAVPSSATYTPPDNPPLSPLQGVVVLVGGNPDLGPQEADTWSLGLDFSPPFLKGLDLSVTYYDIELTNQIAIPPLGPAIFAPAYSQFVTYSPTIEQVQAAVGTNPYLGIPVAALYAPPFGPYPYAMLDFRRQNLGEVHQNGIDFNVRYTFDTSAGTFYAAVAGTHTLERKVAAVSGAPFVDSLDSPGASDLAVSFSVGAQVGKLTASAAWYHTGGYDLDPVVVTNRFGTQTEVDSFDTVDLFFKYDVAGQGLLEDLSLTLNVNNVLDEDPPFYNGGNGYTSGSTLGRLYMAGVRKKF